MTAPSHFQRTNLTRYNALSGALGKAMKRAGSESVKARRRKGVRPKRRNAPKVIHGASIAGQETVVAQLIYERDYVMRTKNVFHSTDNTAEPVPGLATKFGGARSLVAVPLLKDNSLIGGIVIYRQEVRPFTDKQIALVQNFGRYRHREHAAA
jgi:GAF domain